MGLMYRETFQMYHYQLDRHGKLSIGMLLRLLLETSFKQTQMLNPTKPDDSPEVAWFILQTDMTVDKLPVFGQEMTIETEAFAANRFFTQRRFTIYQGGEQLVTCLMKFATVDVQAKKMIPIPEYVLAPYQVDQTKLEPMVKMPKMATENVRSVVQTPRFLDIDENQHVNNAVYVDWLMDALPESWHINQRVSKLSIAYQREIQLGETISQTLAISENQTQHALTSDAGIHAKAFIDWVIADETN